jgi:uncharacterized protein (DUF362 family)/Pyruvate/2-oxoacid:ferredoxin oxidoreductase delta subunit
VEKALREALALCNGLEWLKPGMKVALKANLVVGKDPAAAATTHPAVLAALTKILLENGAAKVTVGDSPSGLYTKSALEHVYKASGLEKVREAGAELNLNVDTEEVSFPEAVKARNFTITSWLLGADAVVDVCKLKSHGMMGMTAAVKNLFGMIPGTMKPEYHFLYKDENDFADMIVDLNEFIRPVLAIADAVVGMEGNGPTMGTPKKIGAIIASRSTYAADIACARMIDVDPGTIPTITVAKARNLKGADENDVVIVGSARDLVIKDFNKIVAHSGIHFEGKGGAFGHLKEKIFSTALETKPLPEKKTCISCGKCANICPAKAIQMEKGLPHIDRSKCIHCFCCQEFCPAGAMKVHRTWIARLFLK